MLRIIFFISALFIVRFANAQDDTLYYNMQWIKADQEDASFYRVYFKQGDIYKVDDYFISGKLFRTGFSTSVKSEKIEYRTGHYAFYDTAGRKFLEGDYDEGGRAGLWMHYYKNSDALQSEENYHLDSIIGHSFDYDSLSHRIIRDHDHTIPDMEKTFNYNDTDTTYTITRTFDNGNEEDEFYKSGKTKKKETFKGGKVVSSQCFNEQGMQIICDTPKIYTYIERMPKSGFDIGEYLSANMKYPWKAERDNTRGRVIVRFIVNEDGTISNVKVVRGIGGGCDEEAMRVISEMPRWQPGTQNGVPVRVHFTLPINFNLR